jgi:hypothetical protein
MASAKKKSSKRSATSSVWPPPDAPTLFIDRSAWSNRLADALRSHNIAFIALHDRFPIDVSDEEWLRVASNEGWIVLSRDKRIRRKPNELAALQSSKVATLADPLSGSTLPLRLRRRRQQARIFLIELK